MKHTFKQFLIESSRDNNFVVIYPGRFQPFHVGHKFVYNFLKRHFDTNNLFIATTDKVDINSPFSFEQRKKMVEATHIPSDRIIKVTSPYIAKEITERFDKDKTCVVFAVSEKDMDSDPRFSFKTKKDGSPSYFQKWEDNNRCLPYVQHGYIYKVPTINFEVLGKPVNSATQIRQMYREGTDPQRKQIIHDLYQNFDQQMFQMFEQVLR